MGIKLVRRKKRNLLLTFFYRGSKLLILPSRIRLNLFLNLEWIFNRLAHEESFKYYDNKTHPIRKHSLDTILSNIESSDIVIDLGCKYGEITYAISQKATNVVGIDYDCKAIEIAKKRYVRNNLDFICSDAYEYLQNSNKNFDVLVLSHILEHIENPVQFLKSIKHYFKRIYIEVPDFDSSYLNQYRKDLNNSLIYSDIDHLFEFDRTDMYDVLKEAEINVISSEFQLGVQKYWCIT